MNEYSVTRTATSRDTDPVTEVLFDRLGSYDAAWDAGHTWLMEHGMPFIGLDIRENGIYAGSVSWEPDIDE